MSAPDKERLFGDMRGSNNTADVRKSPHNVRCRSPFLSTLVPMASIPAAGENSMSKRRKFLFALGAAALGHPLAALSQGAGTVRIYVGFPAGATGDRIARIVAPALAAQLNAPVIVDNRPGAGGQLAIEATKNSAADGAILLQTIGSSMVIYPHTYRSLRYDPFRDFIPVGTVATAPIAFVAAADVPVKTLPEAVALLRRDKKLGFYGSPASGSVFHFSGVLLQRALESDFTHVAYKGSAPLLSDVLGGQVPFAFMAPSDILEHYRAGKLKVLAITGPARATQYPDVPTFLESGFKELVNREWFSYFLAHGTGAETVARYSAALRKVVASDEVRAKLLSAGLEIGEGEAAPLLATMQREYAQWKKIVGDIGFSAD
jgi:tripartite-type tricarboxylate transporter receptor subunit TctC